MEIFFKELKQEFKSILLQAGFENGRAGIIANIFAENSRDGVHSHGTNRFPSFIQLVKDGLVNIHAEPIVFGYTGVVEHWDGQLAPGMYTATKAMQRAIELSSKNGIGCVTVRNGNHWMRGGTYGWQAANAGFIGICATNTIAIMPPWGGKTPAIGNNPLVIAVPRKKGHIVLDMAMSQFSYGKMQEYEFNHSLLPFDGGYDENGRLTKDPVAISATLRALPVGLWKGSALSMILDVLITSLSGGQSTADVTKSEKEFGVSQLFLCISPKNLDGKAVEEIIAFTKSSEPVTGANPIRYPGEQSLMARQKSEKNGIVVNEEVWQSIQNLKNH